MVAPWLVFPPVQLCSQAGVTQAVCFCLSLLLYVLPLVIRPRKAFPSGGGRAGISQLAHKTFNEVRSATISLQHIVYFCL